MTKKLITSAIAGALLAATTTVGIVATSSTSDAGRVKRIDWESTKK